MALALVAVLVAVLLLGRSDDEPAALPGVPTAVPSAGTDGQGASPSAEASPDGEGTDGASTGAATPAGWTEYTDDQYGWRIAVPPGFTQTSGRTSNQTDFRESGTGRLLRVEIAPQANESAIGDWRSYEPTFAGQVGNYQRIRIDPADGGDGTQAADWEFTFSSGGGQLHVLNRGVIDGRTAHALYWQTPDSSWESSTALRDQIFSTFQPPPQ